MFILLWLLCPFQTRLSSMNAGSNHNYKLCIGSYSFLGCVYATWHVIDTTTWYCFLVGNALNDILKYDLGDVTIDCFR
jgi:hypothetical protein